jgi:hypothetical protein
MYSWRITKYNPLSRDQDGRYKDEKERTLLFGILVLMLIKMNTWIFKLLQQGRV